MSEKAEPILTTQTFRRTVSRREAVEALKRLQPVRDGQQAVLRFSFGARLEHLVLLLAVSVLAVTGLLQTLDNTRLGQQALLALGGLEAVQGYHHLFALVLIALAVYHVLNLVDGLFVRREAGTLFPQEHDLAQFFQVLKLNLGLSKKLPLQDRYSFDEKFVYWISFLAVGVLSVTGLVMWFPTWVTLVLPGSILPFAAVFHRWQAVLLVAVVILLHLYQVLLRRLNLSIFTGKLSVAAMQADHPVELAALEGASALAGAKTWPQELEFTLEERVAQKMIVVIQDEPDEVVEVETDDDQVENPQSLVSGETVS